MSTGPSSSRSASSCVWSSSLKGLDRREYTPQAIRVIVGEVAGCLDPHPPLGRDLACGCLQLLVDKALEQRDVFEPATLVLAEEIAGDRAASRLIRLRADKHGPTVRSRYLAL